MHLSEEIYQADFYNNTPIFLPKKIEKATIQKNKDEITLYEPNNNLNKLNLKKECDFYE